MLGQGADLTKFTDADLDKSVEVLQEQIDSGQIRKVAEGCSEDDLAAGPPLAAPAGTTTCWCRWVPRTRRTPRS